MCLSFDTSPLYIRHYEQQYMIFGISFPYIQVKESLCFPCISQEKARFLPIKPIIRDKPCSASLN